MASSDLTAVLDAAKRAVAAGYVLTESGLSFGQCYRGKVRDCFTIGDIIVLVTCDRLSAFDRNIANVPFKGAMLNGVSAYWFNQTASIVPNHVLATPHPNVVIARRSKPFAVEVVVRGYLTGSTSTSIWVHYNKGVREYCGNKLPEGLKKNDPLPHVMLTPTTKSDVHDLPISAAEIVEQGLMTQAEWDEVSKYALALFAHGQAEAAKRGMILVDTKFEFGRDVLTGKIMVIDEVMTPDSSRYWIRDTYASRHAAGQEPENIDKEFLRLWFRDHCDPYADAALPDAPPELVAELSKRYVQLYETITGQIFTAPAELSPAALQATVAEAIKAFVVPPPRHLEVLAIEPHAERIDLDAVVAAKKPTGGAEFPIASAASVRVHNVEPASLFQRVTALAKPAASTQRRAVLVNGGVQGVAAAAALASSGAYPLVARLACKGVEEAAAAAPGVLVVPSVTEVASLLSALI